MEGVKGHLSESGKSVSKDETFFSSYDIMPQPMIFPNSVGYRTQWLTSERPAKTLVEEILYLCILSEIFHLNS